MKFLRALNKTLKFDLQKDDHDSFGPSRRIATQIFFKKHYEPNKFDFCEWNGLIVSQKKNEGILFGVEIQVVGSYTDRLLTSRMPKINCFNFHNLLLVLGLLNPYRTF